MLYEFAVDPKLLRDLNNCRAVFDNFRKEQGRVISDVPAKWIREAFAAVKAIDCNPVMKKSIKNGLNKLRKTALVSSRDLAQWNRDSDTWLAYVAHEHARFPFAAIFSMSTTTKPVECHNFSMLFLNAPDSWDYPTQMSVNRQAEDMVDAMGPLFSISKHIILIDPHIYPNTIRFRNVLIEIISRVQTYNYGRGIKKLVFHTSDRRASDMQSSLESQLLMHIPVGFELEAHVWPESMMHDRFVITDVGGLSFGVGLDEKYGNSVSEVEVSLITDERRRKELMRYSGTPTLVASISR